MASRLQAVTVVFFVVVACHMHTWWIIPVTSCYVKTIVSGLPRLIPHITRDITYLALDDPPRTIRIDSYPKLPKSKYKLTFGAPLLAPVLTAYLFVS